MKESCLPGKMSGLGRQQTCACLPMIEKRYLEHSQLLSECQGFLPGSASQLLKTYFPEGMSEALIRNILFGAVQGLSYLHQSGCIHRYWLLHVHT